MSWYFPASQSVHLSVGDADHLPASHAWQELEPVAVEQINATFQSDDVRTRLRSALVEIHETLETLREGKEAEPLANPFPMVGEASRGAVCDACDEVMRSASPDAVERAERKYGLAAHRRWRGASMQHQRQAAIDALARRLAAGHDVRLLCWCKPARCHCDALAVLLRERVEALRCAGKRRR